MQQIQVTGSYGIEDLKEDLRSYYNLAIGKNTPVVFLMTDGQIIDDHFADRALGGWLNERGLTGDDLKNEARATDEEQHALMKLVRSSFDSDPNDVYVSLSACWTNDFEVEATTKLIAELTAEEELNLAGLN